MKSINYVLTNQDIFKIASLLKKYFPKKNITIKTDNFNKNNISIIFKDKVDRLLLEEIRLLLFEKYPDKKFFLKFKN
ncbi:MAG: hypothetical protein KatS3mg097_333 [Candidatus Parcubacteria bacterium]|nr:MAG: hypothetical protein KatS3mg097_333 [Candidatus Parcubacteria bacterium]